MEKLNKAAAFLDRNPGLADCVVQITYSEMYDIAEAFRELEQRASNLNDGWLNAIAERDEARAKLAEMAKRPPIGRVDRGEVSDNNEYPNARVVCLHDQADWENFQDGTELFLRPAPAADLSAMVPLGWKLVPVEPTPEMLEEIWLDERFKEVAMKRRYYALLAAAPTPPE